MKILYKYIKKILPVRFHTPIAKFYKNLFIFQFYWRDMRHLFGFAKDDLTVFYSLRGDIIKNYHRLEKALASPTFIPGRGIRAASDLLIALSKYNSRGLDPKETQVAVAVSVLEQFLFLQESSNSKINDLNTKLKKIKKDFELTFSHSTKRIGGVMKTSDRFNSSTGSEFENLCIKRHSVRYFSKEKVDLSLIVKAVEIAQRTPSVCNRQGWHVFCITNNHVLSIFRKIHKGFAIEDQNLTTLLLVCFTKSTFSFPEERNQGFVDGGLFSMSLLYALTDLGFATCPLNSNISYDSEKKLRQAMNLSKEYGLVMFIAVGHHKDKNISPISVRDNPTSKISYID